MTATKACPATIAGGMSRLPRSAPCLPSRQPAPNGRPCASRNDTFSKKSMSEGQHSGAPLCCPSLIDFFTIGPLSFPEKHKKNRRDTEYKTNLTNLKVRFSYLSRFAFKIKCNLDWYRRALRYLRRDCWCASSQRDI